MYVLSHLHSVICRTYPKTISVDSILFLCGLFYVVSQPHLCVLGHTPCNGSGECVIRHRQRWKQKD